MYTCINAIEQYLCNTGTVSTISCICCRLLPLIGACEASAGKSCKEIQQVLSNDCTGPAKSGTYWVKVPNDTCSGTEETMQVCMYMYLYLGEQRSFKDMSMGDCVRLQ